MRTEKNNIKHSMNNHKNDLRKQWVILLNVIFQEERHLGLKFLEMQIYKPKD